MPRDYQAHFRHHSKTFSFAASFLGKKQALNISKLYYFFRYVDDIADGNKFSNKEKEKLLNSSHKINELTEIQNDFNIPDEIIKSFIEASRGDINFKKMDSKQGLIKYCYGVASTVGLSMCYLIGVKDKKAYYHAIDLGVAMQLTNICRDVQEDYLNNRIYLPELDEIILKNNLNDQIRKIQDKYLLLADKYYDSGFDGLRYLPIRIRFVIFIAAKLYQYIGKEIRTNNNYKRRAHVSGFKKLGLLLINIPSFIGLSLSRLSLMHEKNLHADLRTLPCTHE